jgi:polyhydroxyalkanoate synthesis repressor PhaR
MLDPDVQSPQPRIIKRYANRKLYDTRSSRYVTLPQIAELVRSGEDVQIIDNRSKENLTSVTLAQIIYESEKSAEASSKQGVKTLRDLIQLGGEKLMAHFREGPVARFIPRAPDLPDLRELRDAPLRVVAPAVEALEELHRRADEKMRTLIGGVLAPLRELAHEVAKLQARIEELEDRIVHRRERVETQAPVASADASPAAEPDAAAIAAVDAPEPVVGEGDRDASEPTGTSAGHPVSSEP